MRDTGTTSHPDPKEHYATPFQVKNRLDGGQHPYLQGILSVLHAMPNIDASEDRQHSDSEASYYVRLLTLDEFLSDGVVCRVDTIDGSPSDPTHHFERSVPQARYYRTPRLVDGVLKGLYLIG